MCSGCKKLLLQGETEKRSHIRGVRKKVKNINITPARTDVTQGHSVGLNSVRPT